MFYLSRNLVLLKKDKEIKEVKELEEFLGTQSEPQQGAINL